jgi:hypothetical protein
MLGVGVADGVFSSIQKEYGTKPIVDSEFEG